MIFRSDTWLDLAPSAPHGVFAQIAVLGAMLADTLRSRTPSSKRFRVSPMSADWLRRQDRDGGKHPEQL
jgi:hypothetical protein